MLAASPGLLGGSPQQQAAAASTNSSTSPTPSLDSLNGMAGSLFLAGNGSVGGSATDAQDNVNSESSSGLGSLAVQPHPVNSMQPAQVLQGSGGGGGGSSGGCDGRSASTSSSTSAGSLASSGLGSSPLGGATLPLFGNGVAPSTSVNVVNGSHRSSSPPETLSSAVYPASMGHGAVGSRKSSFQNQQLGSSSSSLPLAADLAKCPLCCAPYHRPKVLHECFHVYCQSCLEKTQDHPDKVTCPTCRKDTGLTTGGVAALLSDSTVIQLLLNGNPGALKTLNKDLAPSIINNKEEAANNPFIQCSVVSCNSGSVVAKCITCNTHLCSNCVNQHLFNNRFGGGDGGSHLVCTLGEYMSKSNSGGGSVDVGDMRQDYWTVSNLLQQARVKGSEVRAQQKMMESMSFNMADTYTRTKHDLNETFQVFASIVEERKQQLLRELEADYTQKRMVIKQHIEQRQESVTRLFQINELTERLFRCSSHNDLSVLKQLLESRVANVLASLSEPPPPSVAEPSPVGFEANYQAFQTAVRNTGSLVPSSHRQSQQAVEQAARQQQQQPRFNNGGGHPGTIGKQPPISRPTPKMNSQQPDNQSSAAAAAAALNGLVLSSLMDPHSGHHHSGSSSSSGGAGGMNALVQGIATTGSLTSMTNGHDHRSSASGALHSLTNGINGLHLPQSTNGVASAADAAPTSNGLSNGTGSNGIDRMLSRYSNSPGAFSSAGSNSSHQTIGGFDSLFSKRSAVHNGFHDNGYHSHHHNDNSNKWSTGGGAGGGGAYEPNDIAAAVATYKAQHLDNSSLLDPLPMLQQQQQQQHSHHHMLHGAGSAGVAPTPKSQIKRTKMIYHCKFGEFGVLEGQFTEPSGVCVNAQNDIIVADTNNHRIQIFDKDGRFKFQFGECGKRDGQLLYPNRVAAVRSSGDIIVTERSPTHQVQIYNQYGQFVRKFGANILQHPRGVCVDNNGRIIVVECKVMRVIIFNQLGEVLHKFGCSKHLEFPNGVVVNDRQEIFISDNRAHCVKVFNYEGQYLRQIGGEGLTNYPIGVGINAAGEVTIADNHNNFNLSVFSQDGKLLSALESKVKHAQCFDVALMDDGSVVLASKDYRLYIYRYIQLPPIGM